MHWIAPSEKNTATVTLETRLWEAADQFRANSGLKSQEYSAPVLGLIFLRFAEVRFAARRAKLEKISVTSRRFYQKEMKRKTRHARTRGPTHFVGVNKMADGLPRANGASTHQPRATPWELVHQNNNQP
jgi:hypothetical protein